jgi:cytochrome c-type biogenesis protein CcmF
LYGNGETALFLDIAVLSKDGRRYAVTPGIAVSGNSFRSIADTVTAQSLIIQFNKVKDDKKGLLEIGIKESGAITDLITLKVYEFPMINILWLGIVMMTIGFVMSIIQRNKQIRNNLKPVS